MGHYTHYIISGDGSAPINNNYGFRVGYGVSEKFDLKARYEKLVPVDQEEDTKVKANYISLVPKLSLKDRKLALLMPISRYNLKAVSSGETQKEYAYSIAPQVIRTYTSKTNMADFSISVKGDYIIHSDPEAENDLLFGFTLGAGFSNNLDKWAIRPEAGYLFKPGEGIGFWNLGVGFQLVLPTHKKEGSPAKGRS